ncbi:MOSC domain-containing protein [Haloarchaeobius sp. HME9146]|uniref:MOSC domain-containing protein n=1 Tax=Haloarchaeobius sp. HME9146 TaxID=2978732 RepID=UPI0021C04545|nr:MOSC domain-containing protein [Haloarchaeobius sp. HME9146]MCT9097133.1 MOSC domain-containing protein [Haloarchaeobius sp. HME9146]
MTGTVESIHIARESGEPVESVESVEAVSGAGLRGDRYFDESGTFSDGLPRGITLIEAEALEAAERDHDFTLDPGEHRRNVTTRGVALNHLVDAEFRVGDAVCRGVELCEPCSYLESLTKEGAVSSLVHRGGLRAEIVETGTLAVGDGVTSV